MLVVILLILAFFFTFRTQRLFSLNFIIIRFLFWLTFDLFLFVSFYIFALFTCVILFFDTLLLLLFFRLNNIFAAYFLLCFIFWIFIVRFTLFMMLLNLIFFVFYSTVSVVNIFFSLFRRFFIDWLSRYFWIRFFSCFLIQSINLCILIFFIMFFIILSG